MLAQIYGGEWGSGTEVTELVEGVLQGGWSHGGAGVGQGEGGIATILASHVTKGRKQVEGLRCLGCTLPPRLWYTKQARDTKPLSALGSSIQLNKTEGSSVNSPGHPGPEGQTFLACTLPTMTDAIHFSHVLAVSPTVPLHQLFFPSSFGARDGILCSLQSGAQALLLGCMSPLTPSAPPAQSKRGRVYGT